MPSEIPLVASWGQKELILGRKDSHLLLRWKNSVAPLPDSVEVTWEDRFYPKAWGHPELREAIVDYYNSQYGSSITPENVMVFAGGGLESTR